MYDYTRPPSPTERDTAFRSGPALQEATAFNGLLKMPAA